MHLEPVKTGMLKKKKNEKEPLVQMAAKVTEETELISMQESVVCGGRVVMKWEESLRMAIGYGGLGKFPVGLVNTGAINTLPGG